MTWKWHQWPWTDAPAVAPARLCAQEVEVQELQKQLDHVLQDVHQLRCELVRTRSEANQAIRHIASIRRIEDVNPFLMQG